jgi:hypothetical protein
MRKIIVTFCLALICGLSSTATAYAEENQASLGETLDWIKSKIENVKFTKSDFSYQYTLNHNGCDIKLTTLYKDHSFVRSSEHSFNLKDISYFDVIVKQQDRNIIQFNTFNGYEKIYQYRKNTDGTTDNNTFSSWNFEVAATNNLPERIVKAFNHAATLCGGGPANQKKEPF